MKCLFPRGSEDIARAGLAAAPRDFIKQSHCGFNGVAPCDVAQLGGVRFVASGADAKHHAAVRRLRTKPNVGRDRLEPNRAAAIDDDGDFGREV